MGRKFLDIGLIFIPFNIPFNICQNYFYKRFFKNILLLINADEIARFI